MRGRNFRILSSLGADLACWRRVSPPRHARLWRRRPGDVSPAAAPPASGGPAAGIRGLGSNAGSNAAAWYLRPHPLRRQVRWRGSARSGFGRCFALTWWLPTGGSISQGKARGECDRILLGRYQNSNKTLACQSIVFSRTRQRDKRSHRRGWEQEPRRCPPNDHLLENKTER